MWFKQCVSVTIKILGELREAFQGNHFEKLTPDVIVISLQESRDDLVKASDLKLMAGKIAEMTFSPASNLR